MSTAATADAPPPKAGSKKLLIIIVAAVFALVLAGGGAALLLRKAKPDADVEDDESGATHASATAGHGAKKGEPPVFVPLDAFTVNLADKEGERFAQIAVTLEIEDAHFGDQLKVYMPAIRNNILMTLAQKTSAELLSREGKELLAKQIVRESLRPLGIEVPDPAADDEHADEPAAAKKKARRKKDAATSYPIRSVQFASFIVQ